MSIKVDRRVVRTKQAFKEVLLSIIQEKDLNTISITELTDKANYSRGTFYAHYSTIEELMEEVIEEKINNLIGLLREPYLKNQVISMGSPHLPTIKLFEHIAENIYFYKLMLNHKILPMIQKTFCDAVMQHIMHDVNGGFITSEHNINPKILVYYSTYSMLGLVYYWLESGMKYTPKYMAEQFVEIMTNGVNETSIVQR